MTREQAKREIVSLDFYLLNHTDDYGEESHTAMMMAINALEELPKRRKEAKRWKTKAMQNNSCEDAISRQEAISNIREMAEWHTGDAFNANRVIQHLKDLPSVAPKQRTGRWEWTDGDERIMKASFYTKWTCTSCGCKRPEKTKYCPNCGAKMEDNA